MFNLWFNLRYITNPGTVLVFFAFLFTLLINMILNLAYKRARSIETERSGIDTVTFILDRFDMDEVRSGIVKGNLSDNFDPTLNAVFLSNATYEGHNVASVAVAAHECGHAIQWKKNYIPLKLRNIIYPIVNIGEVMWLPVFFLGIVFEVTGFVQMAIILYFLLFIFELITLPTEFNASKRGYAIIKKYGLLKTKKELRWARIILFAAGFTYIALMISITAQLSRLLLIFRRGRFV